MLLSRRKIGLTLPLFDAVLFVIMKSVQVAMYFTSNTNTISSFLPERYCFIDDTYFMFQKRNLMLQLKLSGVFKDHLRIIKKTLINPWYSCSQITVKLSSRHYTNIIITVTPTLRMLLSDFVKTADPPNFRNTREKLICNFFLVPRHFFECRLE